MKPSEDVPYHDEPSFKQPERSRDLALSDEGDAIGAGTRHLPEEEISSPLPSEDEGREDGDLSEEDWPTNLDSRVSPLPPTLPTIETPGGIELPSRIVSKASSRPAREAKIKSRRPPIVPRKSSRRDSSTTDLSKINPPFSNVAQSPTATPQRSTMVYDRDLQPSARLQNLEDKHRRLPFDAFAKSSHGAQISAGASSMSSSADSPANEEIELDGSSHARHSSSALPSLAPQFGMDRPSSIGYVQQHRASENIHSSPDTPSFLASSAEFVEDPSRRSLSPNTGRAF